MSLTHYIIVRRDLPLGVALAMVTHAAGESASEYDVDQWTWRSNGQWTPFASKNDTRAVVLGVKSEDELHKAWSKLQDNCIGAIKITESEGPYAKQFMAIGVIPCNADERIEGIMRPFQLLKSLIVAEDDGA